MNISRVSDEIKTYTYPVIKIIIFVLIIGISIYRDKLIHIDNKVLYFVITVIAVISVIGCWLGIFNSIAEIIELQEQCADERKDIAKMKTKEYTLDDILYLVENNDIIEIEIKTSCGIIKIGSSSDSKWSEDNFFDKLYYCGSQEYKGIEAFQAAIEVYSNNKILEVVSIDGLVVEKNKSSY